MNEGLSKVNDWMKKLQNNTKLQDDIEKALSRCGIVDKLINSNQPQRVRFIRDSLWGNISLETKLVAIVDSPFFQRQRLITKLGLTSLVYPGSTHTLLEHALGCLHLFQSILQKSANGNDRVGDPNIAKIDIPIELENVFYGHSILLHDFAQPSFGTFTSSLLLNPENTCYKQVYFGENLLADILTEAKSRIDTVKPNWMLEETFNAKILSAVFFSSKTFRKFYDNLWCFEQKTVELPYKPSVILAGCILGCSLNDNKHLFWDLYHGPFGVKTVDELVRDTRNCGVRSPIDHQRMLFTANVVHIPKYNTSDDNYDNQHPPFLRAYVIDQFDPYVFRELKMSIELIRSRVYSHPWRKAFKDLFHTMLLSAKAGDYRDSFLRTQDNNMDYLKLWSNYEEKILDECRSNSDAQTSHIASRLIFRQAPKRCLSLSPHALEVKGIEFTKDENKLNHKLSLKINLVMFEQIVSYFEDPIKSQSFIKEAKKQISKVVNEIDHPFKHTLLGDPELYVCVNNSYYDHDVTSVGYKTEEKNRYSRAELFEIDTRSIQNNGVFFYTTNELSEIAYLVLKKMFYERFVVTTDLLSDFYSGKQFEKLDDKKFFVRAHLSNNHTCTVCDLRTDRIEKYESALAKISFYDDCPCICELTGEQRSKAGKLFPNFSAFEGQGGYRVSSDSIIAFTEQFPPGYRNEVLRMIGSIKVLSRDSLTVFLENCIKQLKDKYDNVLLVPLSESSGKHMKAMLGETAKGIYSCKSMPDALSNAYAKVKDSNFAILVYDDNLISGTQALDQFKFWHDKDHNVTEENINTAVLEKYQLDILKSSNLYFSFHVTWLSGRANLLNYLKINNFKLGSVDPFLFKFEIGKLSGLEKSETKLRTYLRKVGQTVYSQKLEEAKGLTKEEIKVKSEKRSLGFDNLEGLFVTGFNVPTATITALWCPGIVTLGKVAFPWKPLLIRTNSLKFFVL